MSKHDGYVLIDDGAKQPFIFTARIEELLASWRWRRRSGKREPPVGHLTTCIEELEKLITCIEELEKLIGGK